MWAAAAFMAMTVVGAAAYAQPPAPPTPSRTDSALVAERDRLRQALDRANREISELKRSGRGVTDDYRLRRKMAEAEDLARRLTAAETRLAGPTPKPVTPSQDFDSAPVSPSALRARADVMADDAGRLLEQASRLERAAGQIRRRATLRGRARQLERDPFAGVAGSKRFLILRGGTADLSAGGANTRGSSTGSEEGASGSGQTTDPGGERSSGPQPTVAPTDNTAPPPGGSGATNTSSPTGESAPAGDSSGAGSAAPPPSGTGSTATPGAPMPEPAGLSPPPAVEPAPTTAAPSSQALLDPGTLGELRRLESGGRSLADAERMEKLAAELQKRARGLTDKARALRVRAAER